MQCEIVEVCNVEDATGYRCGEDASQRCSDCGSHLCDTHGETCAACDAVFCATFLAFHNRGRHEKKPAASPDKRQRRKSA